ncbi:MAG: aminotransferase class I/II-fold pyridoxal phosphate-dependent enzyme [Candidatus Thorarchaeota archaeon]|nr:aminotransferase class I/II-fold pyridoxal phosphate-dependent enzyme [Candidatus Thorarchaeota archaeon]
MKLGITPRAANLKYAIRDIVVAAKQYQRRTSEEPLYLNIGDPIKYDWKTPQYMIDAICKAAQDGWNGYSPSEGEAELRNAAAEKEKRVNGIDVDPDRMIVTAGVSEAIQFLTGALVNPGSEFLLPGPSYPPYISYVRFFGGEPIAYRTIEEEDWNPDTDDLRKKITEKTVAILVINPNNPTGAVYSEKNLREIVSIAGEYGLPLISDEIYDQLTYDEPQTPMVRIAGDVPVVGFNGVSKVYLAPGWRVGYAYFHDTDGKLDTLYDAMIRQARVRICLNATAQIAAATALRGDGSHLTETMRRMRERRDLIYKRLNEIDSVSTRLPEAAFYILPKIDLRGRWRDDTEFVLDVLNNTGVVFVPGSGFGVEHGSGHFRSVFLPPPDMIADAMDRLEVFMSKH